MRFDAVIELGAVAYTADDIGQEVESVTWHTTYANRFSLSRDAFFAAGKEGMRPERVYQLRSCEYSGEQRARVDGVQYDVIYADDRGEWVRLTLERRVAHGA